MRLRIIGIPEIAYKLINDRKIRVYYYPKKHKKFYGLNTSIVLLDGMQNSKIEKWFNENNSQLLECEYDINIKFLEDFKS